MRKFALALMFCLVLIPASVLAAPPTDPGILLEQSIKHCMDGELHVNITEDGTTTMYNLGFCPHGCDPAAGALGAQCRNAPWLLPLEVYLIMLGAVSASLIVGIVKQRWLLCMASAVFYLYLAFQGFIIEHNGHTHTILPLIVLCWFMAIVATGFTLTGIRKASENADKDVKPRS